MRAVLAGNLEVAGRVHGRIDDLALRIRDRDDHGRRGRRAVAVVHVVQGLVDRAGDRQVGPAHHRVTCVARQARVHQRRLLVAVLPHHAARAAWRRVRPGIGQGTAIHTAVRRGGRLGAGHRVLRGAALHPVLEGLDLVGVRRERRRRRHRARRVLHALDRERRQRFGGISLRRLEQIGVVEHLRRAGRLAVVARDAAILDHGLDVAGEPGRQPGAGRTARDRLVVRSEDHAAVLAAIGAVIAQRLGAPAAAGHSRRDARGDPRDENEMTHPSIMSWRTSECTEFRGAVDVG